MNVGGKLISGAVLIGTLSACGWSGEPDAVDIATAYSNVARRNLYMEIGDTDRGMLPPEPGTEASQPRLSAYAGQQKFRYMADKVECKKAEGDDPGYVCLYDLAVMKADGEVLSTVRALHGQLYRDSEGWLSTRFNGAWLVKELDSE